MSSRRPVNGTDDNLGATNANMRLLHLSRFVTKLTLSKVMRTFSLSCSRLLMVNPWPFIQSRLQRSTDSYTVIRQSDGQTAIAYTSELTTLDEYTGLSLSAIGRALGLCFRVKKS